MPKSVAGDLYQRALLKDLKTIKQIVERLEGAVLASEEHRLDPYLRRRHLLTEIYLSGNSASRDELEPVLLSHGTDYHWIAQQVKKGYLAVHALPGGRKRFAVTPKAVQELRLGQEEAGEAGLTEMTKLSQEVFAEDWESEEDAIYDKL
jgi:hypothetical protein